MGNKYTVMTFHISEGTKYHSGHESLISVIITLWKLKRLDHYGCLYLEIR